MKKGFLATVCLLAQSMAWSGSFQQAYEAALTNDATYQAARAEFASTQQNLPLARAGLLPTVSLSVGDTKVEGSRKIDSQFGGQPSTTTLDYRSPVQSLNLRAPLFNLEARRKVTLAQAQVSYAESVLAARKIELIDRLANAWLQQFLAEQALLPARAQLEASRAQAEVARRRLQLGEGTRPELSEAESALDLARALEREALNNLELARIGLKQISGLNVEFLTGPISSSMPMSGAELLSRAILQGSIQQFQRSDEALTELLARAEASNPAIAARKYALAMAQAAVARNSAGHYPRLDLVASASRSRNDSLSTLNQSVKQRTLGLQLSLPLYSGGAVNASVAQALADQDKADAELAAERQTVAREVSRFYFLVTNGTDKLQALHKGIESASLAVEGARKGLKTGFAIPSEVAAAQRKLTQTQYELAQAVSDYLLAHLRLIARTGGESVLAVSRLDEVLQSAMTTKP